MILLDSTSILLYAAHKWEDFLSDDFGVKYVGEEHMQHLIDAIGTEGYKLSVD